MANSSFMFTPGSSSSSSAVPSGTIVMYAGSTAPSDWLLLDGSAISRTTYADLFAVFGTTYGSGDGSTTFNLPDTRGVFIRGAGSQTLSGTTYTGTRGTAQRDQMQGHVHSYSRTSSTTLSASSTGQIPNGTTNLAAGTGIGNPADDGTNGTPRTGTETRPANIVLTYIVKI